MAPKPISKRATIEADTHAKKGTQDDLGLILAGSWVDLGAILGLFWGNKNNGNDFLCGKHILRA